MELIIAILISLGIISHPGEFQEQMIEEYQVEIQNAIVNDDLDNL